VLIFRCVRFRRQHLERSQFERQARSGREHYLYADWRPVLATRND
jgi:hypothetical protein